MSEQAREMTPQERSAAIVDKVKSALTPIWLGGRQRMLLEQEIAEAIIATRRAALLEVAELHQEWRNGKHSGTFSDLLRHKLAQQAQDEKGVGDGKDCL